MDCDTFVTFFFVSELESIVKLLGTQIGINREEYDEKNPYLVVDLPSEDAARQIMKRTVLIRSIYELWSDGKNHTQLYSNLRKFDKHVMQPFFQADRTFRIKVDTFNKSIKQEEKVQRIKNLPIDVLNFQGKADLKNPDDVFSLFEYYGHEGTPHSEQPSFVYFGRWLTGVYTISHIQLSGQICTGGVLADGQRDLISQYHLQNRHFIGNTSMDAGLSLLMANMGQIKSNMLVCDPFVGTGSLLVACAHFGSYVIGTDIDYLLLHARGKPSRHNQTKRCENESIRSNLKQYGLESYYIDAIVADSSKHELWYKHNCFDAIITDPPYGIRESTLKVGPRQEEVYISEEMKDGHIPQKVQYKITDLYTDLLTFAAKYLKLNGKLVYWFPIYRPEYSEDGLPKHPCFKLVSNCEQVLQATVSRRLITMEKIKDLENTEMPALVEKVMYDGTTFRQKFFSKTTDMCTLRTQDDSTDSTQSNSSIPSLHSTCSDDSHINSDNLHLETHMNSLTFDSETNFNTYDTELDADVFQKVNAAT